MTFKAARCPSCGGDLQVPDDRHAVNCMYCGANVIVREAIQAAAGGNIGNWLILAQAATQAGNNQEAYDYYTRVLEADSLNSEAWAGKAEAAGWMSTLTSFRLPEMLAGFQKSIDYAPSEGQTESKRIAASKITDIIGSYYTLARGHLLEYISLDNVWVDYLVQCDLMITGLESAHNYWPEHQGILDYLIFICRDNIQGVAYSDQYAPNGPIQRVKTLSAEYESTLRSKLALYVEKKRQLDPTYEPDEIKKAKASACFIATATMGRADHPAVLLLREFRDEWLMQSGLGRVFIRQYSEHGPLLSRIIAKSRVRRLASYLFIVVPSTWIVRRLLAKSSPYRN